MNKTLKAIIYKASRAFRRPSRFCSRKKSLLMRSAIACSSLHGKKKAPALHRCSTQFICFISVAILKKNRDKLLGKELEDIAQWLKEMGNNINKIDINEIIKIAFEIKKEYNEKNLD